MPFTGVRDYDSNIMGYHVIAVMQLVASSYQKLD